MEKRLENGSLGSGIGLCAARVKYNIKYFTSFLERMDGKGAFEF
jgi:hypothetical protein